MAVINPNCIQYSVPLTAVETALLANSTAHSDAISECKIKDKQGAFGEHPANQN